MATNWRQSQKNMATFWRQHFLKDAKTYQNDGIKRKKRSHLASLCRMVPIEGFGLYVIFMLFYAFLWHFWAFLGGFALICQKFMATFWRQNIAKTLQNIAKK